MPGYQKARSHQANRIAPHYLPTALLTLILVTNTAGLSHRHGSPSSMFALYCTRHLPHGIIAW